jgi:hypothetical protein
MCTRLLQDFYLLVKEKTSLFADQKREETTNKNVEKLL